MEKKTYIKPEALVIELNGEILMLGVSQTAGQTAGGNKTEAPVIDFNNPSGDGDDY